MNMVQQIPVKISTKSNSGFKKIVVRDNIYLQLKSLGQAGDSFNDVLTKILSKQPGVYKIDVNTETNKE